MGTSSSATAAPEGLLERLTGVTPISRDDVFWTQLGASTVSLSAGRTAEDVSTFSHNYCTQMVRNNPASSNFQMLVLATVGRLSQVCAGTAPKEGVQQASSCVFLVRTFLKHMSETLEPEDLLTHLKLPSPADEGSSADDGELSVPLAEGLLSTIANCALDDNTYWLHLEALTALTVCVSGQLFCELGTPAPLPLVVATVGYSGTQTDRVVLRLLDHIVQQPPAPTASEGLLRSIGSGLWQLPWQLFSYFFRPVDSPPPQLADRSMQVLLLLTQHLPPSLFPDSEQHNAFLGALRIVGDMSLDTPTNAEAEEGQCRAVQISFRRLHDTIASSLMQQEGAMVLLYLLLHGNRDFLDHTLSRADPETLLLPMLRTLYPTAKLRANQLYMLLIVLLMLSQDEGFVSAAHAVVLPSVTWYKERILHSISLGSLIVVLLVRAVQFNIASLHDSYVHTNCLAALANMSPSFKRLHPHAARCLVSLYDVLARKYVKLSNAQLSSDDARASPAEAELLADELGMYADFLRMALEVINVVLSKSLSHNEHLVYALLERQHVFDAVANNERFKDLVENIRTVIAHFGSGLSSAADGSALQGEAVWSVDNVLNHIRTAARTWSGEQLHKLPDPRFTYEQEASPEEFFTPYIWLLVFEQAGLSWQTARIQLLPADSAADDAAEEPTDGLPLLSSVEVDAVDELAQGGS